MDVVSTLVAHFQPPEAVDPGAFVPPPTCICPVSRWSRCPAALCAGLCLSFSAPRGIWGSRSPCQHAAPWGVSSADHGEACGSVRWRLQSPRGPWSRGRLQKCGSSRGGGLLGRPQRKALGALLSLICRIRAGLLPPGAGTLAESKDARSQSISSALPSRSNKTRCSSSHTPASCHSLSLRQQVIPDPQPICWGSISQGMPLFSTNRMPVRVARSSTRGLPPLGLGGSSGSSGSITSHSSSVTSFLAIPSAYPPPGFVRRC